MIFSDVVKNQINTATKTHLNRILFRNDDDDMRGSHARFELLICVYTASCWCVTPFALYCGTLDVWALLKLHTFILHQHSGTFKRNTAQFEICFSFTTWLPDQYLWSRLTKLQKPETHWQCLVSARCIAWSCSIDHGWEIIFLSICSK